MDLFTARFSQLKSMLAPMVLMAVDLVALFAAILLAFILRFDHFPLSHLWAYLQQNLIDIALGIIIYLLLFALFRLYHHAWRYASLETLGTVVAANTLGALLVVLIPRFTGGASLSASTYTIFWVLSILFVGGERLLLRLVHMGHANWGNLVRQFRQEQGATRVIILGGGWDGARLLHALHEELEENYRVIGFLDDNPKKHGMYIRGVRVLGPLKHLYALLATGRVDEVLIALPKASGADIRPYVLNCRKQQIPVKVIPGLTDVLRGVARARLEDVSVDDLLRRPPVLTDLAHICDSLTGKRVLVTGAGGSIGSELCRQIIALVPDELVLLGHGENSLHQIHQELLARFPLFADRLRMVVASVADESRIRQTFARYTPEVVFHAAAHKHVPIMEDNIAEAVQNNVFGTRHIAEACRDYGAERMVLISTDKAVYPSSVMGATKWLGEEVLRTMAQTAPETTYIAVRFGNVLGSRGSVVPIFAEQIRRGGPVTITHPEMTRYFMTIPEAVQLVLQAGTIGRSGELFLLDMGKPVKILDLARDMIRLSGLIPDQDIAITFTGLRPGEKMHEQLVMDEAMLKPAKCERMSVVCRPSAFTPDEFYRLISRLQQMIICNEPENLLAFLGEIVPGFHGRSRYAQMATPIQNCGAETPSETASLQA